MQGLGGESSDSKMETTVLEQQLKKKKRCNGGDAITQVGVKCG